MGDYLFIGYQSLLALPHDTTASLLATVSMHFNHNLIRQAKKKKGDSKNEKHRLYVARVRFLFCLHISSGSCKDGLARDGSNGVIFSSKTLYCLNIGQLKT